MELRDKLSEQPFCHLERLFCAITASSAFSHSIQQISRSSLDLATDKEGDTKHNRIRFDSVSSCHMSCQCRCHRIGQRHNRWSLREFGSAIGSIVFKFQGTFDWACNIITCENRHTKRGAIIYTFPPWLFLCRHVRSIFESLWESRDESQDLQAC